MPGLCCSGVASISGVAIARVDTSAAADTGSQQQLQGASAAPQLHELTLWPQCEPCEEPLLQHALQLAEPVQALELQVSVLPSEMPAELLMTYKGEVCVGGSPAQGWGAR